MIIYTYDDLSYEGWAVAAFPTPHKVDEVVALKQWCNDAYGPPGKRWKDSIIYGVVWFEDRKDLTLFLLRWS